MCAEDLARVREHLLAGFGEPQPRAHALEELGVRVALELADLDRDRGRGEVQLLRGAREGEVAGGAFEDAQLPQRGVLH
jgi:hypothetical protein